MLKNAKNQGMKQNKKKRKTQNEEFFQMDISDFQENDFLTPKIQKSELFSEILTKSKIFKIFKKPRKQS